MLAELDAVLARKSPGSRGALALLLVAALAKQRLTVLVDRMLPLLVVLNAAGWLGCWFEGCAYGLPAGSAWWGLPVRDDWGQVTRRFPLQPVGALLGLAIPWIVEMTLLRRGLRPGAHPGWLGALSLLGFALVSLALSFLRGDPTLLWYGLRPEAWGALGLMGTGAFMLIYIYLLEHRSQDKRKA